MPSPSRLFSHRVPALIAVATLAAGPSVASAWSSGARWLNPYWGTKNNVLGSPQTVGWSLVPDGTYIPYSYYALGERSGPSDLVGMMDSIFAVADTTGRVQDRSWFRLFEQSVGRWSEVSGLTFVNVNDDGADMWFNQSLGSAARGDIRIGGHLVGSNSTSDTTAYAVFPDLGDIVMDTSNKLDRFADATNNYFKFRNTLMHELGHAAIGLNHTSSDNYIHLMDPSTNVTLDGPQIDDILAAHRLYGDVREKNGGNDTAATASALGFVAPGATRSVGTSANRLSTLVTIDQVDFVSLDDETDVDWFSFSVQANSTVSMLLAPMGLTYQTNATTLNTLSTANLILALYAADGTTLLQSRNLTGAGADESIGNWTFATGGDYLLKVSTATLNAVQMYRLDVSTVPEPTALAGMMLLGVIAKRRRSAAD